MTEDEKFFAWLDGELDDREAAEVAARVSADPRLQELAAEHRAMASRLRNAFDSVANLPMPDALRNAASPDPDIVDFGAAKRAREQRRRPLAQWAAMAATLAAGVVIGTMIPRGAEGPVVADHGGLYAAAALDRSLDSGLASAPEGPVRIGLTFRNAEGAICRTFSSDAGSGLACRDGSRWQLRGLFNASNPEAGAYRMAAGMDPNLAQLVETTISGEPFDAAQEKAARAQDWR